MPQSMVFQCNLAIVQGAINVQRLVVIIGIALFVVVGVIIVVVTQVTDRIA